MVQSSHSTAEPPAPVDNFYSPANFDFYACQPYEPLERLGQTIRLLAVTKDPSGRLQCTLRDGVPLAEADGTYTAISYCAGDPKKTQSIRVNELRFNAFANLALAIEDTYNYRVRKHGDTEAILWTDQVCINQSNPTERSHQVGLMYQIYSGAREVIVCLSTHEHRGGTALAWLDRLYQAFPPVAEICAEKPSVEGNFVSDDRNFVSDEDSRYMAPRKLLSYLKSDLEDVANWSVWEDCLDMLQQPWWSRAWVFQEYVAARNVSFLYGGDSISNHTMTLPLRWLSEKRNDIYRYAMRYRPGPRSKKFIQFSHRWERFWLSHKRLILEFVLNSHGSKEFHLLKLLPHSRHCSASDKRDHIYAFLGLDNNSYNIDIDYNATNSTDTLFLYAARQVIEKTDWLPLLRFVDNTTSQNKVPSWVPDWSTRDSGDRNLILGSEQPFNQCKPPCDQRPRFLRDGRVLEVSAIYLDTFVQPVMHVAHRSVTQHYKFFVCIALRDVAEEGDQLWLLHDTHSLCILRPKKSAFMFLSEAGLDRDQVSMDRAKRDLGKYIEKQAWQRIRLI